MALEQTLGALGKEAANTLLIRGTEVPVTVSMLEQNKLRFFVDNPRIYSIVRTNGKDPTQDEIERQLLDMEHVRELIQDIRRNGGLMEPLIVKSGTLEVLEGNSRLAAYRFLAKNEPVKWGRVKCTLLPVDIESSLVFGLLGQYHIKGRKGWAPYEQAGFLYRRFKLDHLEITTLASEIGLSERQARHLIETYQFMIDHREVDTARWSYYDEYLKSSKIRKARAKFPSLDKLVVSKIKDEEIGKAVDVRDRLPVICTSSKILQKFATGAVSFEDAYDDVMAAGGDNSSYKRLNKFRQWIVKAEVNEALLQAKGPVRDKIRYELDKIHVRIKALHTKIGK